MTRKRGIQPEERLHLDVARFLNAVLRPPVFWTSIDHGAGKLSARAAGMAKARGVKAGIPDVLIFAPGPHYGTTVIGIELKAPKGSLSPAQKDTQGEMMMAGVRCRLARSIDHVEDLLKASGIPLHGRIQMYRSVDGTKDPAQSRGTPI